MFELMFRHDLLDSGRLRLRETSLPLFDAAGRPGGPGTPADADAPVPGRWPARSGPTCTASPSSGRGAACRWPPAPPTTTPCCDAALDAHLGPAAR